LFFGFALLAKAEETESKAVTPETASVVSNTTSKVVPQL